MSFCHALHKGVIMESSFQFTRPYLASLEFTLNSNFDGETNKEVKIGLNISVNVSKSESVNEAVVSLLCEVGEKNDKCPFWVKAEESANFRWNSEIESEMADKLLNQNAPALLLSYLRTNISQITSASLFGAYDIPFINFTK